jgi:hypothetical protein
MRKTIVPSILAALLAAAVPACRPPSEEARLKSFLKETVALAEKRDLAGVMARLADDYADFEGRDKPATEALVRDYFRRGGIVIHLLGARIEALDPEGEARVEAEVLMSSGAAEVFRKLIRYAGECYRFRFRLRRAPPSTWQLVSAGWETVPLGDLLPESLAALKKLFPDF